MAPDTSVVTCTPRDRLLRDYFMVGQGLDHAGQLLAWLTPRGQDYPDRASFMQALREHSARVDALARVRSEVAALYEEVANQ